LIRLRSYNCKYKNKVANYTFRTIGKIDDDRKFRNLGFVTFDTYDTGEGALSVLKNTIAVLVDEIDIKKDCNSFSKVDYGLLILYSFNKNKVRIVNNIVTFRPISFL
jgi:hypothetical protein